MHRQAFFFSSIQHDRTLQPASSLTCQPLPISDARCEYFQRNHRSSKLCNAPAPRAVDRPLPHETTRLNWFNGDVLFNDSLQMASIRSSNRMNALSGHSELCRVIEMSQAVEVPKATSASISSSMPKAGHRYPCHRISSCRPVYGGLNRARNRSHIAPDGPVQGRGR